MKWRATKYNNLSIRENGIYYYKKGRKEISLKTTNEKEAVQRLKTVELTADEFKVGTYRLKVAGLVPDYLESRALEVKSKELRIATYNESKYLLEKYLVPFFGNYKLTQIDSSLWDNYRRRVQVSDVSNHRKVFGHFLKWCKKKGYIKYLPDMDVNQHKRRPRRILTPHEIKAIWGQSEGSLKLFISMALFMGMRRGEIMKLSWERVDFQQKAIFLREEDTKTKEARWVPIAKPALELLLMRQSEKLSPKWVFPHRVNSKNHAYEAGLRSAWNTCKKNAGLGSEDITFHDLRATCEYYNHKRTDLSETQLEKYFGADIRIQRGIYVSMNADDVRGVENSPELLALIEAVGKAGAASHD